MLNCIIKKKESCLQQKCLTCNNNPAQGIQIAITVYPAGEREELHIPYIKLLGLIPGSSNRYWY